MSDASLLKDAERTLETAKRKKFATYPRYKPTGDDWLGKIPVHWGIKPLKYVASINDDTLPESTDLDRELNYVDIGSVSATQGILVKESFSFEDAPSRARRIVRAGDTIVSTVRTYLRAIAPICEPVENLVVSTGFAVVRPREVKPGYLSFVLRASYFVETVVSRSAGVSYPAITASEVGLIHIPVPSEEEQEAIARFLDRQTKKIDELIAAKRALLDLLKEKRQALITHAVTKGLDPNVKLKSSGIDWLGDVPEHWEVLMLKRVWAGCDYGISETLSGDGTVRVLTMSNICDGRVHLPDEGCLEDIQPGLCLRNGDLLFNRTNSLIHVAKVGLYEHTIDTPVTFASYLVRIRMNERALPKFMNFLLNAPLILQFARSLALPSINQANLNPARYGRILIALPPPSEQHEIVGYLMAETAKIDTMLETTAAAIQRLQDYRTSLISAAVTGKIDVRGEPV